MPITSPIITTNILSASPDLTGIMWTRLVLGLSNGIAAWAILPTNVSLQGVTTGVAGAGTVTGKIYVPPIPLPVSASLLASGLTGLNAPAMGRAIGMGVANAFNASALYQGVSAGVGTGTDISKVTLSNGSSLVLFLSASCAAAGLVGVNIPRLCQGLAPGIAAVVLTGSGTGVVTGSGSPLSAGGTSVSRVV